MYPRACCNGHFDIDVSWWFIPYHPDRVLNNRRSILCGGRKEIGIKVLVVEQEIFCDDLSERRWCGFEGVPPI